MDWIYTPRHGMDEPAFVLPVRLSCPWPRRLSKSIRYGKAPAAALIVNPLGPCPVLDGGSVVILVVAVDHR